MDKQTKINKNKNSINDNKINNAFNDDFNALKFKNSRTDNSTSPADFLANINNISESSTVNSSDISTNESESKTRENATKEIENKSADNANNISENIVIENTNYTQIINEFITEDYAVIDPYEICEFQPEVISTEKADINNIDTGDTLNEKVHNMSVALTKGKSGAIFLPLIVLGLPFLLIAVCSLLVLSPLTAIIWSLLNISVYNLHKSPDNKVGFKNFFKPITDKTLISATAVYRVMTLFLTLFLFLPSLIIRLNYCMFPFILNDKRVNGENPDMIDLFAESKELMKGHRLEYLSLMLYSLPSIILTALTLGIISIWSIPYLTALKANFYVSIKSKYIATANKMPSHI